LLYHLPQAVLAAVIIMAVIGLINFGAVKHAWQANRHDGIAAVATFVATLVAAPHLDKGIMIGAGLAIGLYLYRTMTPRVAILGRHPDGTLRDVKVITCRVAGGGCRALRRPPLLRQCVLLRGRHPRGRGRQPARPTC
jgi:MFS superfamily sulfate permease-like transporter